MIDPSFTQMSSAGEVLKQWQDSQWEINRDGPGHRFIYRRVYLTGYAMRVARIFIINRSDRIVQN